MAGAHLVPVNKNFEYHLHHWPKNLCCKSQYYTHIVSKDYFLVRQFCPLKLLLTWISIGFVILHLTFKSILVHLLFVRI